LTGSFAGTSDMMRARWVAWNVLTALSFLLFLASLALWARSYRVRDTIGFGWAGGNSHVAQSILGRLHVLTTFGVSTGGRAYHSDWLSPLAIGNGGMSSSPREPQWRFGFIWQTYDRSHFPMGQIYWSRNRLIVVPYWFPAALFALAPAVWAAGVRRRVGLLD